MIDPVERLPLGRLGRAGLALSRLGFGSAPLGGLFTATPAGDASAALATAWDAGLRYFDTAPQYGAGLAEARVGAALRERPRGDLVLSSKVGKLLRAAGTGLPASALFKDAPALDVVFDYSHDGVLRSIEESLGRLGLDRLDIVFVHDVNRKYHGERIGERLDEALAGACPALARLRAEGVIRAFGPACNEVDIAARFVAEGDVDCVMLPGRYTLLDQSALPVLLPACLAAEVAVILAGPFDSGILATGAVAGANYNYAPATAEILARVRALEEVCREHEVALPAAALQFGFGHPAVASVVAGMRSSAEVEANVAGVRAPVPAAFWRTLVTRGLLPEDCPLPS